MSCLFINAFNYCLSTLGFTSYASRAFLNKTPNRATYLCRDSPLALAGNASLASEPKIGPVELTEATGSVSLANVEIGFKVFIPVGEVGLAVPIRVMAAESVRCSFSASVGDASIPRIAFGRMRTGWLSSLISRIDSFSPAAVTGFPAAALDHVP